MSTALNILAGIAFLYAAEQFFSKRWRGEDTQTARLDIIICALFSIFLLLLAFTFRAA